jgi:hypothetical protein
MLNSDPGALRGAEGSLGENVFVSILFATEDVIVGSGNTDMLISFITDLAEPEQFCKKLRPSF